MLLQCSNIDKAFGADTVLSSVSFGLEENEKAAIVGINGAGKSTLLRIITGEMTADSGNVTMQKGLRIGYLAQLQAVNTENTIYEEVMSAKEEVNGIWQEMKSLERDMKHLSGNELKDAMARYDRLTHLFEQKEGYAMSSQVTGTLKGLGFADEDYDKKVSTLSGGEKTRVALSKLLLSDNELIILDEPTNHLDLSSIAWLEAFIKGYKGAVLIVAHDRYFLDRTVTKIIELENGRSYVYSGNYSAYAEKKAQRRKAELKAYLKQQDEIAHQEAVIEKLRSFNREKSIKRAESREKLLNKTVRLDKPVTPEDSMRLFITPSIESGKDVLSIKDLSKSYKDRTLFSGLGFDIRRGERVAIIGKNGTGKTTILKIINDMLRADTGTITLGAKVHIGYYDQDHQVLSPEKTLFSEIQDAYPDLDNTKIRNTLAAFLFTGDDVFKQIKDLSGGERARVSLARLMLSNANFLILDEPTNHLDMVSKEILENALISYTGTLLYVSHDRYFINKTATRIMELYNNTLTDCEGDYDYYMEKRDDLIRALGPDMQGGSRPAEKSSAAALDFATQKAEKARIRKLENDLKKCEEAIEREEKTISSLEEEMADPLISSNAGKLNELTKQLNEANEKLNLLMEQWEELSQALV